MTKNYLFVLFACLALLLPVSIKAQDTVIENTKAGELKSLITDTNIESLIIKGDINRADLDYINNNLLSLKNLDLRDTKIKEWIDPEDPEWGYYPADMFPSSFTANPCIERMVLPESITNMGMSCLNNPAKLKKLISYSSVPPMADEWYPFIGSMEFLNKCVLYVPNNAIETYKEAPGWGFATIKDVATEGNDTPEEEKEFELSADGKTLVKWNGNNAVVNMNDYPELQTVEIIGSAAFGTTDYFSSNELFTEITLTDNITTIEDNAFASCVVLEKVNLGSKIQSIGVGAFMSCEKLNNVVLPASVTSIGRACFSGCSMLANIEWPVNITTIPNSMFYKCSSISSITLPESVEIIGNSVFEECSALKDITWGNNIKEIGYSTFAYCTSLESVSFPASLKNIGEEAFTQCSSLKDIKFGGVELINSSAFKGCAITTTDMAESNIKEIGVYAFSNNPMTEIVLPVSIISVGDNAFQNCSFATSLIIPEDAPIETINDRAFKLCSSLKSVNLGSIKNIGNGVFAMCDNLEDITWSENLVFIGSTAFMTCPKIKSIVLPESVETLDDWAFYECTGLESFKAGNCLMNVGQECFALCSSLKNVELGSGIELIKKWAFQKNTSIETFTIMTPNVAALEEDVFMECDLSKASLIVADGLKADYEVAAQWKEFGKIDEFTSTGIEAIDNVSGIKAIYDINGARHNNFVKGVNIVKMNDGRIKKVIIK